MPGVCRYYNTLEGCRFGDRCRYQHIQQTRQSVANGSVPCHFYRSKKGCRYGNSCHFSHDQPSARLAPRFAPPPTATPAIKEEAAAEAKPPVAAEVDAKPVEDASVDSCKTVVLYDPEIAEANLLEAALKGTLRVERKRKPGTELQMAKCSQCKKSFSSAATPADSSLALRDHYVEKFGKVDQKHVRFFNVNSEFSESVYCYPCDRYFQQYRGLFRHMHAKMLNAKDSKSAEDHKKLFEAIAQPFVEKDTGYEITDEDIVCDVEALISDDNDFDDYDFYNDYDDGDDCDEGAGLLLAMGLAQALRNRDNGGIVPDYDDDDFDDEDDEFGSGMLGFTGSECFELMCQGVKPWDEDAGDVLAALEGAYYY